LLFELGNGQWNIPKLRRLVETIDMSGGSLVDYEVTHFFPQIGEKAMRLNGVALAWPGHELILLAIEDVTAHKAVLDELEKGARRREEFLAMLAHELRGPLAPIRNAFEIWRRGDASATAEQEAQGIMDRQLEKQARLVDDLLDISRITRGDIALQKEPIDLAHTVRRAVEGTRNQLDSRQHELTVTLPADIVMVEGDAARLEQVISNLLTNAAKYTEPKGRIALTLERQGEEAVVAVVDNGIGIAPELLPKVFDPFVQAKRSLDRSEGGLGIGLTLVRRLVELHRGRVEAKSGGLLHGSEFVVHLPLASHTPPTRRAAAPSC
jgi:two-component system, chemotaxis family, CheB/CheR fusion protein